MMDKGTGPGHFTSSIVTIGELIEVYREVVWTLAVYVILQMLAAASHSRVVVLYTRGGWTCVISHVTLIGVHLLSTHTHDRSTEMAGTADSQSSCPSGGIDSCVEYGKGIQKGQLVDYVRCSKLFHLRSQTVGFGRSKECWATPRMLIRAHDTCSKQTSANYVARKCIIQCPVMHVQQPQTICLHYCLEYTQKYTSVKIIPLNEYGCRDAPCEKSWKQGNPLSNITIKDTSTIMRKTLCLNYGGLRMIVLVSLIVILLRGFPCFHDFSHGASLHPYSFNGMIFTLVQHIFRGSRTNAAIKFYLFIFSVFL